MWALDHSLVAEGCSSGGGAACALETCLFHPDMWGGPRQGLWPRNRQIWGMLHRHVEPGRRDNPSVAFPFLSLIVSALRKVLGKSVCVKVKCSKGQSSGDGALAGRDKGLPAAVYSLCFNR